MIYFQKYEIMFINKTKVEDSCKKCHNCPELDYVWRDKTVFLRIAKPKQPTWGCCKLAELIFYFAGYEACR